MAQGLDSTGANNLMCLITQCAHVLYVSQSTHKGLKFGGANTASMVTDKMHSLQKKLRSCDINMVGKHKQLHVLAARLVSIRHNTWIV